jgi:glycosyltransferase involved in cell wall biosynthesis
VILSQNPYKTFAGNADAVAVARSYRHPEVMGVVVGSQDSCDFFALVMPDLQVERIHYGVDSELHHPFDEKRFVVSYIPRKLSQEATDVLGVLELRGALDGWDVVEIAGVDERTYASILRRSRVFLCFSHREGLGLPPLEAMAAGCIVVGFDGFGGRELFREHGVRVENGDVMAFVRSAEEVLLGWKVNSERFERAAREASEYARRTFSAQREAVEVHSAFEEYLKRAAEIGRPDHRVSLDPYWGRPERWRVAGDHARRAAKAIFGRAS